MTAAAEYEFKHETGRSNHDGGATSGYYYTLVGSEGETGEHDCVGNRDRAGTSSCTVTDETNIGDLQGVRIRNSGEDSWTIVKMEVEIDGVVWGVWEGSLQVDDYTTKDITFTRTGKLCAKSLTMAPH